MEKLTDFLKKIFLPSFTYNFSSSLPSDGYIGKIPRSVTSRDGKIVAKNSNDISFYLDASKIFGFPSFGKVLFEIKSLKNNEYRFDVQFFTYRKFFLFAASILSTFFLVNIALTGELNKIVVIPIIFLCGHLFFLGMLLTKTKKIKDVLFSFDE
jgi:hypothetical protein